MSPRCWSDITSTMLGACEVTPAIIAFQPASVRVEEAPVDAFSDRMTERPRRRIRGLVGRSRRWAAQVVPESVTYDRPERRVGIAVDRQFAGVHETVVERAQRTQVARLGPSA